MGAARLRLYHRIRKVILEGNTGNIFDTVLYVYRHSSFKGCFFHGGKGELMKNFLSLEDLKKVFLLDSNGLKAAYSSLQAFALYITLFLIIAFTAAYLIVKRKKPENLTALKNVIIGAIIGYAITLSACIGFFMVARMKVKEELNTEFYLMLGFFALCLCYAIAAFITKLTSDKAFKICNAVGVSLAVVYGFVLLFVVPAKAEEYKPLSNGMYVFSALLILTIALVAIFFGKGEKAVSESRALSFAGVSVALSFALSYVKLFSLPQGGSITLASMLPLIIYSYVFGARKGIFAGVVYGLLQCVQSPQIYQPMQVLLDYPVAFGAIGVAGIAKNIRFTDKPLAKFAIGASVACLLRYIAHVISGYYVFSSWAMAGYTAVSWAIVYNLFVIAELAIILVVGSVLFSSKAFVAELDKLTLKNV